MAEKCFKNIKDDLLSGRNVLFSGTACQIEAVTSYLGRDYSNLFLVDIICMGIPSPGLWKNYIDVFFKDEKIRSINFKDKSIGWTSFCVNIKTNKRKYLKLGKEDDYMRLMFEGVSIRPSCFKCPYKKMYRRSDITLADCWGYDKLNVGDLFDNKGLSSVFIHNERGKQLFEKCQLDLKWIEGNWDIAAENNENLYSCITEKNNKNQLRALLKHHSKFLYKLFSKSYVFTVKRRVKRIINTIRRRK